MDSSSKIPTHVPKVAQLVSISVMENVLVVELIVNNVIVQLIVKSQFHHSLLIRVFLSQIALLESTQVLITAKHATPLVPLVLVAIQPNVPHVLALSFSTLIVV